MNNNKIKKKINFKFTGFNSYLNLIKKNMKKTLKYKNKKAIYLEFESNVKEVNSKMLLKILNSSKKKNMNIRYCLHNKRNDKQQEMVICQKQKLFFPPKKNTKSDQTFLILYGKLFLIIFNSQGKKAKKLFYQKIIKLWQG